MAKHINAILTLRRPEETVETAEASIERIKLLLATDPSIEVSAHVTVRENGVE